MHGDVRTVPPRLWHPPQRHCSLPLKYHKPVNIDEAYSYVSMMEKKKLFTKKTVTPAWSGPIDVPCGHFPTACRRERTAAHLGSCRWLRARWFGW